MNSEALARRALLLVAYVLPTALIGVGVWRIASADNPMNLALATGCALLFGAELARFAFNRAKNRVARFFYLKIPVNDPSCSGGLCDWIAVATAIALVSVLAASGS
jgi:hypothetical protein